MHTEQEFRFGTFRLLRSRRLLLENDRPIRLGSRALDLLTALLERAGEIVSKEDLIAYAWPTTVVEETSLRFHLSSLRKAIGDGQQTSRFIANISGRGYCFVGDVQTVQQSATRAEPAILAQNAHNLPVRLARMIGREGLVESIAKLLLERRFVTIVGPGGMGKSTLALALCDEVLASYAHGAWFVDLSPLSDGQLAVSTLASSLGVVVAEADPMPSLSAFLRDKQILIVLDNCERVVDAAAVLAEDLTAIGKGIHVLTTSREPLGARGEWLQSLPPLQFPESLSEITAAEAMASPAVQLFVERAVASQDSFELHDWEAASVVNICRRLDGMPLAIELAAAHIDTFGVSGLVAQMDDWFPLRYQGRRTGPLRHQTLHGLLDWSYDLLNEKDRELLRSLAVFTGVFTMEAASAVYLGSAHRDFGVSVGVESLALKSLIVVIPGGGEMYYRLLDTTRAYAIERLEKASECDEVRLRHAGYLCGVLARADDEWNALSRPEWLARYSIYIDDIRSSLDWEPKSREAILTSIGLVTASFGLANRMSFEIEFIARLNHAMNQYVVLKVHEPLLEFKLCSLMALLTILSSSSNPKSSALLERATDLANEMGSYRYRAEAANGQFAAALYAANYPAALKHADELGRLASQCSDAAMALAGDRIKAQALFLMGNLKDSRRLAERVLRHPNLVMPPGAPYPMDPGVSMRILLARGLWCEGYPDQALDIAMQAQQLAEAEPVFAQCLVLSWAVCPVAIWSGKLELARITIDKLKVISQRYGFALQQFYAYEYDRVLVSLERGEVVNFSSDEHIEDASELADGHLSDVIATMGPSFLSDDALSRLDNGSAPWCAPEVLRAMGERARTRGDLEGDAGAASLYQRSLEMARQQGALSWALRTAISVAEMKRDQGRADEGHAVLDEIFRTFEEGFETTDLVVAARLLAELSRESEPA